VAEARATTPREWAIAIIGGLAFAALLILWLRPPSQSPIANSPAPREQTQSIAAQAPPAAAPQAQSAAARPPLILRGLLPRASGGSAIFESEDGSQRLVALGRPAAPGWRLAALDTNSATLETESGARHRFTFEPANRDPNMRLSAQAAPDTPPTALKARVEDLAATSTAYRLALKPIAGDTEITGWAVQTPETIPLLRMAGMRPGDVLLSVNGQPLFSEEKLIELPEEIASARSVELVFMRGGQKATVRFNLIR
jgi:general secretion pathway protein C